MVCRRLTIPYSTCRDLLSLRPIASSSASRRETRTSIAARQRHFWRSSSRMGYLKLRNETAPGSAGHRQARLLVRMVLCAATVALLSGCRLDMHLQPKYLPYEPTTFFPDGRSERQPVPGTIARGQLRLDELYFTGKENGAEADEFPFPVTRRDLERGRERYNIFCSPFHDYTVWVQGFIVHCGFPFI